MKDFGDDAQGRQVQEMVIAKLYEAKRFSLTEKCDRADFAIKGSVTERTGQAFRSESEGVSFSKHELGAAANSSSGVVVAGGGAAADHETLSSSESKQHAVVTLRLVDNQEGDILWAISLESTGGKTKGAIGDAAERAVRRLLRDIERAEKLAQKQEKPAKP